MLFVREDNVHFGTFTYSYDHAGNILCRTEYPFTLDETITAVGTDFVYEYKQHGWKDQLTSLNGKTCAGYDELGNPRIYKSRNLAWQGRRLLSYKNGDNKVEFTYDANGVRTSKTVTLNGEVTQHQFIFDENKLIAEQIAGSGSIYYIYGVDGIAGFKYGNETYLFRKNVQGDITHIYTAGGVLVAQYVYDAWGRHKVLAVRKEDNAEDSSFIGNINPFRYRGYYYDTEPGLYYLQTRYYDPQAGRFISADSIDYLDPETLGGLNLYAYCNNNPVMGVDPEGTWDWGKFWQGLKRVLIGIAAIVVGVLVLASGVAGIGMMFVAGITVLAGALTTMNGVAEIGEAYNGYNFVRDGIFGGNEDAYNIYARVTETVAVVGTAICGGWLKTNAPRIKAYKNANSYNVKGRHLPNSTQTKGKFISADTLEHRKLLKEAIKNTPMSKLSENSYDSFKFLYECGKVVGTKEQTRVMVVFSVLGKIITFFPK